ncbi:MAG TPA: pyridoxamine 5'-phosphate oxidase [Bacteroidota bacterium]|jgi:pyridoxamine-phosphate oxidase
MLQSPEESSKDLPLLERDIAANPLIQFDTWYKEATTAGVSMPHAMLLSTATKEGKPSARVVLLKDYGTRGFVFFTNYGSRKGRELQENPHAALTFHWVNLERQVRIEGTIVKVSPEESEEYFHSRPRISQISAVTSMQSEEVESREELETKAAQLAREYEGKPVPPPKDWGGYVVRPQCIEFWQGRSGRLHDRILYELLPSGQWSIRRLQP